MHRAIEARISQLTEILVALYLTERPERAGRSIEAGIAADHHVLGGMDHHQAMG
ncbi:hypothetical protein ACQPTN_01045 [Bradyrhizobium sp. 13971]